MLTKEEAEEFMELIISGHSVEWNERARAWINKFTEKPKREIQVGDIYRDGDGIIREMSSEETDFEKNIGVMSKCGYCYSKKNGVYIGDCGKTDLDISVCYQLVECEDD